MRSRKAWATSSCFFVTMGQVVLIMVSSCGDEIDESGLGAREKLCSQLTVASSPEAQPQRRFGRGIVDP